MKKIILAIAILSTGASADAEPFKHFSNPTKETKYQGVLEYGKMEVSTPIKSLPVCSSKIPLIVYARRVLHIPMEVKNHTAIYADEGDEKGYSLCRDKKDNIRLIISSNKLFVKEKYK